MTLKRETTRGLSAAVLGVDPSMPWAIDDAWLGRLSEALAAPPMSAEAIQAATAAMEAERAEADRRTPERIGLIRIRGIITPRPSMFSLIFGGGGGGLEGLRRSLDAMVADESVSAIVLDIDSPGGSVSLVEETAQAIAAAAKVKPVTAVANAGAASAAYWLGSQATEFVVTPSGRVGSVGVVVQHVDYSGMNERMGVEYTFVHAGRNKVEGNAENPLDEEARAEFQRGVDDYYAMFLDAVARGRGVTAEAVEEDFGQGRMFTARRAVEAGLVDRIASLEDVLAELAAAARPAAGVEGDEPGDEEDFGAAERAAAIPRTQRLDLIKSRSTSGFRACTAPIALTDPADDDPEAMPDMDGHFAVTDEWTEVDSSYEGHFMEKFAQGAFKKTLAEQQGGKFRVIFQHGRDPMVGSKPMGRPDVLHEDAKGAFYNVPLLATEYNRELVPGLRAKVYGASHRFIVVRQTWNDRPGASEHNPKGLPERVVREARLIHAGPVSLGQYGGATSGVRSFSITDAIRAGDLSLIPDLLAAAAASSPAPSLSAAAGPHAGTAPAERREDPTSPRPVPIYGSQERPTWFVPPRT